MQQCSKLIYKEEAVHEVYENWGAENSEKLIKCQICYENWLKMANLKRKSWKITRWFDSIFLPFSMWLVLATVTINKNKENAGWAPLLLMFTLSTTVMILSPFFSDFILFIYQKILERKYIKKLKKQEQKIAELTKKFQEKVILRVELYWKVNQIKSGKINNRTITEVLGKNWRRNLRDKKESEDISIERNRLIKKIDDELKLAKLK